MLKSKSELIVLFMSSKGYVILYLLPIMLLACAKSTKKVSKYNFIVWIYKIAVGLYISKSLLRVYQPVHKLPYFAFLFDYWSNFCFVL